MYYLLLAFPKYTHNFSKLYRQISKMAFWNDPISWNCSLSLLNRKLLQKKIAILVVLLLSWCPICIRIAFMRLTRCLCNQISQNSTKKISKMTLWNDLISQNFTKQISKMTLWNNLMEFFKSLVSFLYLFLSSPTISKHSLWAWGTFFLFLFWRTFFPGFSID